MGTTLVLRLSPKGEETAQQLAFVKGRMDSDAVYYPVSPMIPCTDGKVWTYANDVMLVLGGYVDNQPTLVKSLTFQDMLVAIQTRMRGLNTDRPSLPSVVRLLMVGAYLDYDNEAHRFADFEKLCDMMAVLNTYRRLAIVRIFAEQKTLLTLLQLFKLLGPYEDMSSIRRDVRKLVNAKILFDHAPAAITRNAHRYGFRPETMSYLISLLKLLFC